MFVFRLIALASCIALTLSTRNLCGKDQQMRSDVVGPDMWLKCGEISKSDMLLAEHADSLSFPPNVHGNFSFMVHYPDSNVQLSARINAYYIVIHNWMDQVQPVRLAGGQQHTSILLRFDMTKVDTISYKYFIYGSK